MLDILPLAVVKVVGGNTEIGEVAHVRKVLKGANAQCKAIQFAQVLHIRIIDRAVGFVNGLAHALFQRLVVPCDRVVLVLGNGAVDGDLLPRQHGRSLNGQRAFLLRGDLAHVPVNAVKAAVRAGAEIRPPQRGTHRHFCRPRPPF